MTDNTLPMQAEKKLWEALDYFLTPKALAEIKKLVVDVRQTWIEHTAKQVTEGMQQICSQEQKRRCDECAELVNP